MIAVFAVTVCAFQPALFNGFVDWDDEQTLTANLSYRGLGPRQLAWMWTTFHTGHFQPLTWMSWGFDYLVWGMNPVGYHLGNILLHAANAALVALIAAQVFARANSETSSQSTLRRGARVRSNPRCGA